MMFIALDLDDVVVAFNQMLLDRVNEEFDSEITLEEITHWDWWNDGSCKVEFPKGNLWEWLKATPEYWGQAQPIPGALNGIKELKRRGHTVQLVTSKPDWSRAALWQWMATYNPVADGVTIVTNKGNRLQHARSKFEAVGDHYDLIIDDKPQTCEEWRDEGKYVILFDRPWNRDIEDSDTLRRAKSWAEVLRLVDDCDSWEE